MNPHWVLLSREELNQNLRDRLAMTIIHHLPIHYLSSAYHGSETVLDAWGTKVGKQTIHGKRELLSSPDIYFQQPWPWG